MKSFGSGARVWVGVALAVGMFGAGARAEKVATLPAPTGYVDDYAGVLSESAHTELEGLCREVHDKTRAQIFFVTVKTLDGAAVTTFANELFAKWKIGEKKTDRGILILLATADHKYWTEVGYGFEGILNDAKVGDFGREMIPALKASNFDEAARIEVRDVARVIAADSGVTLEALSQGDAAAGQEAAAPPAPERVGQSSAGPEWPFFVLPLFFVGVFGLVIWGVVKNRGRGIGGGGGGGYFPSGGSDSGGSFGGDSGGGGGGFSGGDGGSSGGGGAGGSW